MSIESNDIESTKTASLWDIYLKSLGKEDPIIKNNVEPSEDTNNQPKETGPGRCSGCFIIAPTVQRSMTGGKLCTNCFAETEGVIPESLSKKQLITVSVSKLLKKLQSNNPGN